MNIELERSFATTGFNLKIELEGGVTVTDGKGNPLTEEDGYKITEPDKPGIFVILSDGTQLNMTPKR